MRRGKTMREHQGKRASPSPGQTPQGNNPADTFILHFQHPELADNTFLSVKLPALWGFAVAAGETDTEAWHQLQQGVSDRAETRPQEF